MTRWHHSLLPLALGVPCLAGSLAALHVRGAEHWLLMLALGAMCIWGPAIFLAGAISLLGTQRFLRKAASAKGRVSDIYEVTLAEAVPRLCPSRIVTVQFWTEQEEAIEFHRHTFQGNPESAAGAVPILYDPARPSEAKIRSFEGLWLTPGLVMVTGVGLSILLTSLFVSALR